MRNSGYEIISIKESFEGISDKEVIDIAKIKNGILITEDKDFGEWVFSHNIKELTVILLRYKNVKDYKIMEENVVNLLKDILVDPKHRFITLTHNKIRIREI
ncbi:MAG TPA: DUF5615 family PIN-like protein [Ignavibacteria bacterium]|nr:DUF5615 family PIN-like protein [Ignavibacteria bacterium]